MADQQQVYVLTYSHKHGDDVTLHADEGGAEHAIAEIARSYWGDVAALYDDMPATPDGLTDKQVTETYFDYYGAFESYSIELRPVQGPGK
jgi:hypothetical protein